MNWEEFTELRHEHDHLREHVARRGDEIATRLAALEANVELGKWRQTCALVERLAIEVYHLRMHEPSNPRAREQRDRMERPEPGDLVVETTRFRLGGDGVGIFVRQIAASVVVECLQSGLEVKWENAEFVAVLTREEVAELRPGAEEREP